MKNNKLQWGLLSTARINNALFRPLRESKRNDLLGVASRSETTARAYAAKNRIPKAYASYDEMLADPEIDVVYNPLPNHLHAEWTIKAVEAGKHVLCEKPLALTPAEVDAMAAAAQKHKRVVTEAFMYRHHPQTLKVKEMIDAGLVGQVQVIRGAFHFVLDHENDIRLDPAMGGGALWDVGCYPLSYTRMLLGQDPVEVFGWQAQGPTGIDVNFTAQMRFANGVLSVFDCGFRSNYHTFIDIVGSEGVLHVPVPFSPYKRSVLQLFKNNEPRTIRLQGQDLYRGEVEDMYEAVTTGRPSHLPLADSRANVATILALLESARTGKPVKV
jgi:D-xylose 1-dehydrogenase (NADP+, D-xylono-1,5-lactone-forming)